MDEIKLIDKTLDGVVSNCCSAPIYEPDICSSCKEHCDYVNDEVDDDDAYDEDIEPEERLTQEEIENNND